MRTGSTRTNVAYIWPPTLRTSSLPGKLVYLDLNHWIELSKAHSRHPNGRAHLDTLDSCIKAVSAGEAIFPLPESRVTRPECVCLRAALPPCRIIRPKHSNRTSYW